jgi:hypothetical protein
MGWKNVRDHYGIVHIVHVSGGQIAIGSRMDPHIIEIDQEGRVVSRRDMANDDLARYLREMDADPSKLRELVTSPDFFETVVPVYSYEHGGIVEDRCENLGFPNVTVLGALMFEGQYFPDRATALEHGRAEARRAVEFMLECIAKEEAKLSRYKVALAIREESLAAISEDGA